jgi:hypothetical protein
MDIAQLDSIRSKILRMKEIESGLPELDAEIESSEQRLAACKEEANILLAEITKGKEGRIQLVDELKRLSDEIDGLTLEDLDELRRQAEIKEQHLATKEGTVISPFLPICILIDILFSFADFTGFCRRQKQPYSQRLRSTQYRNGDGQTRDSRQWNSAN